MSRNLRALALALVAVFAIGAVAASGAQATEFFHSHKKDTILTGTGGPGAFSFANGAKIECKVTHYEGTAEGVEHTEGSFGTTYTAESITVHPIYTECNFGATAAVVRTNECHLVLSGPTTETVAGKPHGNIEITTCPKNAEGKPIEVELAALGIIFSVENQLIPHCANYTSNKTGTTEEWDVTVKVTCPGNIAWKCTKGKAACTTAFGASEGNNSSFTNEVTVKGFEYIGGTTGSYKEGAQTGIWKGPTE